MGKIRGTHSSPGVYTKFTDLSYAAKTLGITTLGIAGETLKGPAFEPAAQGLPAGLGAGQRGGGGLRRGQRPVAAGLRAVYGLQAPFRHEALDGMAGGHPAA